MPLARFRAKVEAGAPPAVEVNGKCLPEGLHVSGMGLQVDQMGTPVFTLAVSGEGTVEGEGIVTVYRDGDEIAYLRHFLENLDPDEWERRALAQAEDFETKSGVLFKRALLAMMPK